MKQINYFKFLEKFPEFIDIEESDNVKLTLLSMLKKMYWRKKDNDKPYLLPISWKNVKTDHKYYRDKGLDKYNYAINFKNHRIFSIQFIENGGKNFTGKKHVTFPIIHFQMSKNLAFLDTPLSPIHFLSNEELKNWKRTILIDNMLKISDLVIDMTQ